MSTVARGGGSLLLLIFRRTVGNRALLIERGFLATRWRAIDHRTPGGDRSTTRPGSNSGTPVTRVREKSHAS